MEDQLFEVYIRTADGDTKHMPLREGLENLLDMDKGYRLTINIEGIQIVLRNSWDLEQTRELDAMLGNKQRSIEVLATIKGLSND